MGAKVQKIQKWVKKNFFLLIVVLVYSFFALFHLGAFIAPQTFHEFGRHESLYISLPKEQTVSKVMVYTGITYGDVDVKYAVASASGNFECNSCKTRLESMPEDSLFKNPNEFVFAGSLSWHEIPIKRVTSQIKIDTDEANGRGIFHIGEIAVIDSNNNPIEGVRYHSVFNKISDDTNEFPYLNDEQDVVQTDYNSYYSSYFDEVYFAETAYEYAHGIRGYEDVHPPLGKIIQAIPIFLTGKMVPFTWRIMGAITGIIIIISIYYLSLEIFHNDKKKERYTKIALLLAATSTLILGQTRLGTVDSYLCLFTILSYLFMLKFVHNPKKLAFLALSGLFFGCAFSVKWSGAFGGIGLAILYLRKNHFKNIKKWLGFGTLFFVFVPAIVYFSSYLLFPKTTNAHNISDVIEQGQNLYEYHSEVYDAHPSQSKWYTWPISLVPFYYTDNSDGSKIILHGNYVLCYLSLLTLVVTCYYAFKKKDEASFYIIVAYLSLLLPYAFISRPMFLYHYLPASIFSIASIANFIRIACSESKIVSRAIIIASIVMFMLLLRQTIGV